MSKRLGSGNWRGSRLAAPMTGQHQNARGDRLPAGLNIAARCAHDPLERRAVTQHLLDAEGSSSGAARRRASSAGFSRRHNTALLRRSVVVSCPARTSS